MFQKNAFVGGAQDANSSILGGKYIGANPGASTYSSIMNGDTNPYIDAIAGQAGDAAIKAANRRFGAAGLGQGNSTAYSDVVSKNVADATGALRYQNFNDTQNRQLSAATAADSNFNNQIAQQLQALGMVPALNDAQYAGINPALNLLNTAATIPYVGLNAYSGTLNNLAGRYGTTTGTTTQSGGLGTSLLGLGGAALGGWASGGFR